MEQNATTIQERTWTAAQSAAIETRGKTLLVSAAAGSGKTTTLTERVIRLLTDPTDPHDVSRMVIVTFTVAAANDLRAKLTAALNDAIRERPGDRRLPEQLLLLPDADIGTIDSFCRRLVAEFSDCAGLSPNYRVCDPAEEKHLLRSVLTPFIDRLFAGEEPTVATADEFCDFVSHLVESRNQEDLSEIVLAVLEQVETVPEGADKLDVFTGFIEDACNRPPERTVFGAALLRRLAEYCFDLFPCAKEALSDLAGEPDSVREELDAPLSRAVAALSELSSDGLTYDAARSVVFELADADASPLKANYRKKFAKEADPEFLRRAKTLLNTLRDDMDSDFSPLFCASSADWREEARIHAPLSVLLSRLIHRFADLVAQEKRKRNVASFADVERAALRVLIAPDGSTTDVAREVASRYDAVFVDEYQDVNPIQHAVFEAISGERNRFLVGDVKQSIYSFRRAEPSIFIALKRDYPPLGKEGSGPAATIFLSENFRCDRPVIDFVNGVFGALFGAAGESIGYADADRLVFAKAAAACNPTPVLPLVRMFKKAVQEEGAPLPPDDEECAWVADEILRLTKTETRPDGSLIKPEDVAILLRVADGKAAAFRSALVRRGIPASVETNENFFDSPEIRLALCLLNAVDNPRRDVPLVGLLRSPLYDFSPDLLVAIRREASIADEPFYDALVEYCDVHPDFAPGVRFLSQLAAFRRAAEGMPVDRLILKLFTETGLFPIGGAANRAGREKLLLFYQYARAFEATSFRGLYRFIAYLNDLETDGQKLSLQPPANAAGVRIMTIHHSKGLEFPVVFVSRALNGAAGRRTMTQDGNVSFSPRFGLTSKVHDETGLARIDTPFRRIADYEAAILEREEEMRVLYVALTRARERLYVTGLLPGRATVKNKLARLDGALPLSRTEVLREKSFLDWILRAVGRDTPLAQVILPPSEDEEQPEPVRAADSSAPQKEASAILSDDGSILSDEEVERILSERFAFRYAFPWLRTVPGKLSVSVLSPVVLDGADDETAVLSPRKKREVPDLPRFLSGKKESDDPALRGTATHEFLQFCDLSFLRENGVEAELNRLIDRGFMAKESRALVNLAELEAFRATPLADEMLSAAWMRRELRFNMMMPASCFTEDAARAERLQNVPILVQGVMDCVFTSAEGELVLLDYKTDRLRGGANASESVLAEFTDRHRDQLRYYSIALERILGKKPDRILLYPLCLGRPIPVTL
ncbi:MAG: UvrD-helicase domain-containing protein [Clostridia bacterium]|nr:UvrD-helicase domain-containing protein [Clostridia bacterium]